MMDGKGGRKKEIKKEMKERCQVEIFNTHPTIMAAIAAIAR